MSTDRSRDGVVERAMTVLRAQPGRAICMQCLADALKQSRATMHAALVRLGAYGQFTRVFDTCAVCGKHRLVLSADA